MGTLKDSVYAAFQAVGESEPEGEFFQRIEEYELLSGGGIYLAYWDSNPEESVLWIGVYNPAPTPPPLHLFKKFLDRLRYHPDARSIQVSTHQSPVPRSSGNVLSRLGFAKASDHIYVLENPGWTRNISAS